jgi:5'-3' exonuclease
VKIALGVFLGSDYHEGVKGIGVQRASRLVAQLGESQVLETLLKKGVHAVLAEGQPKKGKANKGKAAEETEDPGSVPLRICF